MAKRKSVALSPVVERLLDAAVDIRQNPDATDRAFMARQLVQCTLPHSDPGDVPVWSRTNGAVTLKIRPDFDTKTLKPLYPYGSIPRLLLFWLVTEATQKKDRHIRLGKSLDAFMRDIGLSPNTGGGKRGAAKRLHSQMGRLFQATITLEDTREDHVTRANMVVSRRNQLWWDAKRLKQDTLFESYVELSEDFYTAITAAPVPVDYRALRALKRSPLALDLYAWGTYTAFAATKARKARVVPWDALHAQMGGEYTRLRAFRAKVIAELLKVQSVFPELKVEVTPTDLIVYPSAPAIAPKS